MTVHWTKFPEYDAFLREGVATGTGWKELAEQFTDRFGIVVTDNQLRFRTRRIAIAPADITTTPEERFAAAAKRERAKALDLSLAREMASAAKAQARWDEFLD